ATRLQPLSAAPPALIDPIGPVPTTPIMRWLFNKPGTNDRFCQQIVLRAAESLQERPLVQALQVLFDVHDALRLRRLDTDGGLTVEPTLVAEDCLHREALVSTSDAELASELATSAEKAAARLSLRDGRMVDIVWLVGGAGLVDRLLLTIHHLAVDGVSWRVLV